MAQVSVNKGIDLVSFIGLGNIANSNSTHAGTMTRSTFFSLVCGWGIATKENVDPPSWSGLRKCMVPSN